MRRTAMLPLLTVVLSMFASACQGDGPTVAGDPSFAKGGKPGPPDDGPKAEFSFAYDTEADHTLGSDCWKMSPEATYGKTFWCADSPADPTFVFQVLKDGEPVESGEITFERCEAVKGGTRYQVGTVMDWTYCGVLLKKYRRFFGGVYYTTADVADGLAHVTLDDFWTAPAKQLAIWGMHWEYDQGDGGEPEAEIRWLDLAHVGYANPPDVD